MKISIAILLGCLTSFGMEAHAQYRTCVDSHLAKVKESPALGIAPSEVDRLVSRVSESIGLKRPITLVPCSSVEKAYAWPDDKSPELEYIIYNPDWIRGILGKDEVQAIALFGHEMGHFFNGDFTVRKNFSRKQQEIDADYFAGCAVARISGDFAKLEDLFYRLRDEQEALYPSRLKSLESAKNGFSKCGGGALVASSPVPAATPGAGAVPIRRHPSSLNVAVKQVHDHVRAFGPQSTSVIWGAFVGLGDDVVTTTNSGDVTLWKPKSGEIAQRFIGTTGTYSYSYLNESRGWIATPGLDGSCHVWSLKTGQRIATIPVGGRALSVAFLPQRRLLACGSESDGVVAMNENGWQESFRISPYAGSLMRDIAFFQDGRVVGVGEHSNRGAALVSLGNNFAELSSPVRQANAMIRVVSCLLNGGHVFATAGQDGTARIYRASDGFQLQSFGHRSAGPSSAVVNSIEFSSDCNLLLTASLDGTVRIWDIINGSQRKIFDAGAGYAWTAKFSPDQTRILATYEEGCAVIWNIESGQKVAVMGEHLGRVMYGVFSSDGQKAVTTSLDGTAIVWKF